MTEKTDPPAGDETAADLRGTLTRRLVVAAVLVAILLGVLAFFDYLATSPEEPEAKVFTQPVPVAPKKEVSQPVTAAETLPEPPAPAAEAPAPATEPGKVEVSPAAVTEAKPATEDKTAPVPVSREAGASPKPQLRTPVATTSAQPAVRATPEATAAPTVTVTESAPPAVPAQPPLQVAKPNARLIDVRPVPLVPAGASRTGPGFVLQAGVFSSAQRAEELHAKLTLSGVPSILETRVQVGPFRSRQEAEAAQAKLRELGVETILVPPRGK
jgi:DedD protein